MSTFRTIIHDRRIELPAPPEMPDGTEVLVVLTSTDAKIGLDESEWEDDPKALADWSAWLETIEPVAFTEPDAFDAKFRQMNVEAVRKQMFGD